jgi:hypothetical protein
MEEIMQQFVHEMAGITSQLGEISKRAEYIIQGLARIEAGLEHAPAKIRD